MENTDIKEFYKGKNLFITGGTGFVGLALVEKILRCIPEIGNIYLLVRPKKGKEINDRLEEYKKNHVFDRLQTEQGTDVFNKLIALAGDVGEENLGLSEESIKTVKDNVHVVFHSAATLDFEADLKTTVIINLLGTRRVVQLCKEIKNLKVLLHVSSAYVNSNLKEAEEVIYPAPEKADKVIEIVNSLTDKALLDITPTILGTHLNTYTFTKALAEHEVADSISSFPSCIIRPSMIVAAWEEPTPGWTCSKNGPQGFIMGAAKGVVRRLPMREEIICDYIPVDKVINSMLVGATHAAVTKPSATPVYHLTTGTSNPFRWQMMSGHMDRYLHKYPLKSAVWYPTMKFIPSIFWYKISALIFHFIPAYILDFITKVSGGRPILVKLHTNVNRSLEKLEPFIFNEWKFHNQKTLELHKSLSDKDKATFGIDVSSLVWIEYFEHLFLGVREYLNNEKPSTLPAAKKKDSILWVLNILVQLGVLLLLCLVFSAFTGCTCNLLFALPLFAGLFALL